MSIKLKDKLDCQNFDNKHYWGGGGVEPPTDNKLSVLHPPQLGYKGVLRYSPFRDNAP
jgi:hypothetical protein